MKKYKAVLWDFDGTVINTNDIIIDSFQTAFRYATGKEGDVSEIVSTFGEPLYDTLKDFFGEKVDECIKVYRDFQKGIYYDRLKVCDGVYAVIKELHKRGYKQAVVTSRYNVSCYDAMKFLNLEPYFEAVITCEDCAKHKPDPEPALKALEALDVSAEDAILIGDSKHDMGCGRNAGVTTMMVGWSMAYGPLNKKVDRKAVDKLIDLTVGTPEEILKMLE